MKPLELTFRNWGNKVEIVNKYVSDKDNDFNVSLDNFFKDKIDRINCIQADIEGAERSLLNGAKQILKKNKELKISICCYHKRNDGRKLSKILKKYNFHISFSFGYIVSLEWPYLRKGVIYAEKNNVEKI